jgi:hypothetical protein
VQTEPYDDQVGHRWRTRSRDRVGLLEQRCNQLRFAYCTGLGQLDDAVDQGEVGKVSFIILQDPDTDSVPTYVLEWSEPLVVM